MRMLCDQGHSQPQFLSLAVGCVCWIPPQQDHTTWSPTRQPCGPGDRPYPPRPRSHLVTHIMRFVTHPARKSIFELDHGKEKVVPLCTTVQTLTFLNFFRIKLHKKNTHSRPKMNIAMIMSNFANQNCFEAVLPPDKLKR